MRLGILGGGQLARMLALAAHPLGVRPRVLDPSPDAGAGAVAEHVVEPWDDARALARFATGLDAVTCEFENVPVASLEALAADELAVRPGPRAFAAAQDRIAEKTLFTTLGIPTPAFAAVDAQADLEAAVARLGLPAVLKTRRLGYDGKGQAVLRDASDLPGAVERLGGGGLIVEAFVAFRREVSVIAVRGADGDCAFYPLSENAHAGGILRVARSRPGDPSRDEAVAHVARLLEHLDYVGVLALEMFDTGAGLLANEIAPRVHNSGHWSIEGAETSQFENQVRAVLGLPLGAVDAVGHAAMVNFIGAMPPAREVLAIGGAHLHDYAKSPRAGRKVGHATVRAESPAALEVALARLVALAETHGDG
ncbi:MAG: 5-(carboxyamino)imidazole ribonucleotide synthase [Ectothiorhodospiraceae bacterium]|nr:5-(carboxyamino)imidazole ribonucleotide synthase [Ectothiorhodospiraceae bacterium]